MSLRLGIVVVGGVIALSAPLPAQGVWLTLDQDELRAGIDEGMRAAGQGRLDFDREWKAMSLPPRQNAGEAVLMTRYYHLVVQGHELAAGSSPTVDLGELFCDLDKEDVLYFRVFLFGKPPAVRGRTRAVLESNGRTVEPTYVIDRPVLLETRARGSGPAKTLLTLKFPAARVDLGGPVYLRLMYPHGELRFYFDLAKIR